MRIRVIVAHPDLLNGQALGAVVEHWGAEVVGYAAEGPAAVALAIRSRPRMAILDAHLPLLNGVDCACKIRRAFPQTKIIIMTNTASPDHLHRALQAGVAGYVRAAIGSDDLIKALDKAAAGSTYIDAESHQWTNDHGGPRSNQGSEVLTMREREILQLISEGKTSKEIACLLGISLKTADSHRHRISIKLEMHQIADLVHYAVRQGMIEAALLLMVIFGAAARCWLE
jgi:DNA-binding NarL/FixJ family response regulator